MTDARMVATAVKDPVGRLGGAFMISREAKVFAQETGFAGWAPYFRGRCGVLGEVDADVVVSAAGFFPGSAVREAWEAAASLPAAQAANRYAVICQEFGRRKLAGFPDADRLADLLQLVVGRADVTGAPLFAGWRAMPLADDGPARVSQLAHVLRELRNGLHLVAVLATGLSPLEAVLTGTSALVPGGEANAEFFGWPRPYPDATAELRERRARAEQLTDGLVAPAFEVLSPDEGNELVTLLGKADATVFG
ncbi:SCO6745 family protein [Actinomadura scrupuli]|uniref:SCO6745 family protein n=1 Tax=Actinomadura scrupuli TaxID=559629 RepID=UPI003D992152